MPHVFLECNASCGWGAWCWFIRPGDPCPNRDPWPTQCRGRLVVAQPQPRGGPPS